MITRKTIIRPADTTAYSVGDVINANGVIVPIVLDLGESALEPWLLYSHVISSNPAETPAIDMYFYSDSFTIAADNAAFSPSDSENANSFLGKISHSAWTAFANNKISSAKPDAPIEINPLTTSSRIYLVLVAASAYTPLSGEEITVKADIQR